VSRFTLYAKEKNFAKAKYPKFIINYQFNLRNAIFLQHADGARNPVEPGFPHAVRWPFTAFLELGVLVRAVQKHPSKLWKKSIHV